MKNVIALCVLVTLPPTWKMKSPNVTPYWQIEVADQKTGRRFSNTYRVTSLDKAHSLAERIARERKLEIVTKEPDAVTDSPAGVIDVADRYEQAHPEEFEPGAAVPYDFDNDQLPF